MNNLQMWSLLVGFLLPLVTAVVQQPKWSSAVRASVGALMAIVFGLATSYFDGSLGDASNTIGAVLVVGLASLTFYKQFWTPTKIAPNIEAATSPGAYVEPTAEIAPAAVVPGGAAY